MIQLTLEELVVELREETEFLFGASMSDWKYSGVEFQKDGPYLKYYPMTGQVSICISNRAKTDFQQLLFQLAHEVCHLLHPSKVLATLLSHKTTVLNEGISTYYQVKKMNDFFKLGSET